MKRKKQQLMELKTPFEKDLCRELPFAAYPRPQLKRDSYLCLNGQWLFLYTTPAGEDKVHEITVPFPPESRLSGIRDAIDYKRHMIYLRTFTLPEGFKKDRVLLHFGAVDQYAKVAVNDQLLPEHVGGYLPFTYDITGLLREGENQLCLEVRDQLDPDLPYGKQRKKRGGMWYTPISGIWQTVWLESVPEHYIEKLKITPEPNAVTVEVFGGAEEKLLTFPNGEAHRFTGGKLKIEMEDPHYWSPEDPYLYEFTLRSGEDEISSYFALRTVTAEGNRLLLNGKPYFFHGVLDQGYFSDGIFLPATEEGFENDIRQMKACGFNMLRKHIKLEPELFYYYCDKLGMIVFQDMINSGKYSFLRDTAIPTVLTKKRRTRKASKRREAEFYRTAEGIIDCLYNHPSVCYYTIFNEGWGQFEADRVYADFKSLDPTRVFDTTSGWFRETASDVESEHVYFKPVRLKPTERPLVLSEFGGYSCRVREHTFNLSSNTGYHFFTEEPEEFQRELIALYDREILPAARSGLSAAVLTQLSDVEDETNGLLTYDRALLKVEPAAMRDMAERLFKAFEKKS